MKNVKFISCRETPEGYLLRETSTGVVLEKYHITKKTVLVLGLLRSS